MKEKKKRIRMKKYKLGARAFDFLIGVALILIGANMILFPSSVVWLFFAGIVLRGLFAVLRFYFTRKSRWDLCFGIFSLVVGGFVPTAAKDGMVLGYIAVEVALAVWAFAWGASRALRGLGQKRTEPKKWLGNVLSGVLIMLLSAALFIGLFATDAFVGYTGLVSGITFAVLGLTSVLTALNWNLKKVPK